MIAAAKVEEIAFGNFPEIAGLIVAHEINKIRLSIIEQSLPQWANHEWVPHVLSNGGFFSVPNIDLCEKERIIMSVGSEGLPMSHVEAGLMTWWWVCHVASWEYSEKGRFEEKELMEKNRYSITRYLCEPYRNNQHVSDDPAKYERVMLLIAENS